MWPAGLTLISIASMHLASLLIVALISFSVPVFADSARIALTCWSPYIHPADAEDDIGIEWTLSVSSFPDENRVNGEMEISGDENPYTHEGYFLFENFLWAEPAIVGFVLDIPLQNDDGSAMFDFYELENEIYGQTTEGEYINPVTGEQSFFSAVWYRSAEFSYGTVELYFADLGVSFQHTFQLLAFTGTYDYERNGSVIEGDVAASNPISLEDVLSGPLDLTIESVDILTYPPGEFTSSFDAVYSYLPGDEFERFGLEYVSNFIFLDGYPGTGDPDFKFWLMTIESDDANNNQVPDMVEDAVPVDPPSLKAVRVPEGIQITITGTAGITYSLQRKVNWADEWTEAESVPLSSSTHVMVLPADGPGAFFRLEQL